MRTHLHFKRRLSLSLFALLIFGCAKASSTLTHTLNFSMNQLHNYIDTIDGIAYLSLDYEQLDNIETPGHPALPCKYLSFSVPYNAVNISVVATPSNAVNIYPPKKITPAQMPKSLSDSTWSWTSPDSAIYATNAFYPNSQASISNESFVQGENHVITVAVIPITYNPVQDKLKLYKKVKVQLSYELGDSVPGYTYIVRSSQALRTLGHQTVSSYVVNPTQVEDFAPPATAPAYCAPILPNNGSGNSTSMGEIDIIPHYEYLIISTQELKPALRRIVALKRQKGMTAGIVTLDDIRNTPLPGLEIQSVTPFVIREYLRYAYSQGTKYVLLAGDIPYKIQEVAVGTRNYHIPTDWYYCELSDNWTAGYSVNPNSPDYGPELYVGRLMCNEREQIANNTDKLIRYSLNPGNGNADYVNKSMFMLGLDLIKAKEDIFVPNAFYALTPDTVVIREAEGYQTPKGSDIITLLNNTQFGFLSFHNHGVPSSIATYGLKTVNNNITAYDTIIQKKVYRLWAIDSIQVHHKMSNVMIEANSGLNNMRNRLYPSIAYSIACDVMPFDTLSILGYRYNVLNMGQSFTLGKDYGGPVFLGNTRSGYVGCSARLEESFANVIKNDYQKVGEAEAWSKYRRNNGLNYYLNLVHNLFGDPELEMWTNIPSYYSGITETRGNNSIVVSGLTSLDTVAYTNNAGESLRLLPTAGVCSFNNISPNGCIMVYRHNYIPYIAPLILQNETIENDQYIIATSLTAGNHVDNRTSGDFIIPSGKQFEVEYSEKVVLAPGFKVNKGGVFKARLGASTYKNR